MICSTPFTSFMITCCVPLHTGQADSKETFRNEALSGIGLSFLWFYRLYCSERRVFSVFPFSCKAFSFTGLTAIFGFGDESLAIAVFADWKGIETHYFFSQIRGCLSIIALSSFEKNPEFLSRLTVRDSSSAKKERITRSLWVRLTSSSFNDLRMLSTMLSLQSRATWNASSACLI